MVDVLPVVRDPATGLLRNAGVGETITLDLGGSAQLDLGLRGTHLPFIPTILLGWQQSNGAGNDATGLKTILANIWSINAAIGGGLTGNNYTPPTAIVPAAFGTAPFANRGTDPIDPATAFNNMGPHMANALRAYPGFNPDNPILLIPWFYPGNSIRPFNAPTTPAFTSYRDHLTQMLTLANAWAIARWGKPIRIIYALSSQHERDSTSNVQDTLDANGHVSTYGNTPNPSQNTQYAVVPQANTKDGYTSNANTLIAWLRSLEWWHPSAVIGMDQPKLWGSDPINAPGATAWSGAASARWDAISAFADGSDPLIGVVRTSQLDGVTQSHTSGSDHIAGTGLVTKGGLHFQHLLQATSGAKRSALLPGSGLPGAPAVLSYINGALMTLNGGAFGEAQQAGTSPSRCLDPEFMIGGANTELVNTNLLVPIQGAVPYLTSDLNFVCWSVTGGPSMLTCAQGFNIQVGPTIVTVPTIPLTQNVMVTLTPSRGRWLVKSTGLINTPGFQRGGTLGAGQGAALALSAALVADNVLTASMTVAGKALVVTGTWSGGNMSVTVTSNGTAIAGSPFVASNIANSDAALAQMAVGMQAALLSADAGWTATNVSSTNLIGLVGTGSNSLSSLSTTITGGASQATGLFGPRVFPLTAAQSNNQAYACTGGGRFVLPASNTAYPCQVELIPTGGDIVVDVYPSDQLLDRNGQATSSLPGTSGMGPGLTCPAGIPVIFAPDAQNRWRIVGGYNPAPGPPLGGVLGVSPFRLLSTGPLATGSSLQLSGTINGTAFAAVTQAYGLSSAATFTQAAIALQAALVAVVAGVTCAYVPGQNIIQIDTPAGTTLAISAAVTGGASPPTISQDAGTYTLSNYQCMQRSYSLAGASTPVMPNPNAGGPQRVIFSNTSSGTVSITATSTLLLDKRGVARSSIPLRPGQDVVFENTKTNVWQATGGSYKMRWAETFVVSATVAANGDTGAVPSAVEELTVRADNASTLASFTYNLPGSPNDGDTYVGVTVGGITAAKLSNNLSLGTLPANGYFKATYFGSTGGGSKWARTG